MSQSTTKSTVSNLLDHLISAKGLKNDAALSRYLGIRQPDISKLRRGKMLSAQQILTVHEISGLRVAKIRELSACYDATPPANTDTRSTFSGAADYDQATPFNGILGEAE